MAEDLAQKKTGAGGERFSETRWSVVLAAADRGAPDHLAALEKLCESYWRPLYAYVRRRGYQIEEAQDLTQAFFARLIQKGSLWTVEKKKGKFRSFLLGAMNHFLANERTREQAVKRGGDRHFISIEAGQAEGNYQSEPAHETSPEKLFERQWALTILDRALRRLDDEWTAAGKKKEFDILKDFLGAKSERNGHEQAAEALGATSNNIAVKAHRMRKRYRELVEAEIAQTVSRPEEIEEERQHLLACLSH